MKLTDISLLGGIHTVACVLAMITGSLQLFGKKGTAAHAKSGNIYFISMVVANVAALFIFHGQDAIFRRGQPPVSGQVFGVIHWLAVITLVLVLLGRLAASRQQRAFFAYVHPIVMILGYWFLLGGAINEAFVRVDWVRQMALMVSPRAHGIGGYKLLYLAQGVLDVVILTWLVIAVVQVRRFRRQPA